MQEAFKQLAKRFVGSNPRQKLARAQLNMQKRFYRTPFSLEELRAALLELGDWLNRTVWVQASWDNMYNLQAKPGELLRMLRELTGANGNLVMPAFPIVQDPAKVFSVDVIPSGSGILSEFLRRQPDAKRSIHLRNSVCAVGPAASEICGSHHLTPYSFGEASPFGFLRREDALCVLLGTVTMGFTPLHLVECALHEDGRPLPGVLGNKVEYRWKRKSGEAGVHWFFDREGKITPNRLRPYFTPEEYTDSRISNLSLQAMPAKAGISRALKLANQGVTMYRHI